MFRDAIANAFTTGRLALDLSNASSERALILGLLADVGRPAALRVITRLVADRIAMPDEEVVAAALDAVAPGHGKRLVMGLPRQRTWTVRSPKRTRPDRGDRIDPASQPALVERRLRGPGDAAARRAHASRSAPHAQAR